MIQYLLDIDRGNLIGLLIDMLHLARAELTCTRVSLQMMTEKHDPVMMGAGLARIDTGPDLLRVYAADYMSRGVLA
jgi:hypothetical protein